MSRRFMDEIRLIAWPWVLMTLAGLAPLTKLTLPDKRADWPDAIAVFGFFGGGAILTALSFRAGLKTRSSEFVSVERHKAWSKKMLAITLAVVSASLFAGLAQMALGMITWQQLQPDHAVEPVLLLAIIVSSTAFWTLLARSVIGGLILTSVAQLGLYLLLVLFVTLVNRMAPVNSNEPNLVHTPEVHAALAWFVGGFGLGYAAIMLWLGRKRYVRQSLAV